jgi:hypothetical protein
VIANLTVEQINALLKFQCLHVGTVGEIHGITHSKGETVIHLAFGKQAPQEFYWNDKQLLWVKLAKG